MVVAGGPRVALLGGTLGRCRPGRCYFMPWPYRGPTASVAAVLFRSSCGPVSVSALFQIPPAWRSASGVVFQSSAGKFQPPVIRGDCRRLAGTCSCRRGPGGRQRGHTSPNSRRRVNRSRRRTARAVGLTFERKTSTTPPLFQIVAHQVYIWCRDTFQPDVSCLHPSHLQNCLHGTVCGDWPCV